MPRGASTRTAVIPARQNFLARPNEFDHATWIKVGLSVTANADAGPPASALLTLMADVASLPLDAMIPAVGVGITSAIVQLAFDTPVGGNKRRYTISLVAKDGALGNYGILLSPDGGGSGVYFGLAAGVVGVTSAGYTASIVSLGSGCYQCIATMPSELYSPQANIYLASANGVPSVSNGDGVATSCFLGGAMISTANRPGPLTMTGTPLAPGIRSTP